MSRSFVLLPFEALDALRPLTLQSLQDEHAVLTQRLHAGEGAEDAVDLWQSLGIAHAGAVPDMNAEQVRTLRQESLA
jgi:malonate decarboxylase beta subunit